MVRKSSCVTTCASASSLVFSCARYVSNTEDTGLPFKIVIFMLSPIHSSQQVCQSRAVEVGAIGKNRNAQVLLRVHAHEGSKARSAAGMFKRSSDGVATYHPPETNSIQRLHIGHHGNRFRLQDGNTIQRSAV